MLPTAGYFRTIPCPFYIDIPVPVLHRVGKIGSTKRRQVFFFQTILVVIFQALLSKYLIKSIYVDCNKFCCFLELILPTLNFVLTYIPDLESHALCMANACLDAARLTKFRFRARSCVQMTW